MNHVWMIEIENSSVFDSYGAHALDPWLKSLPAQGAFLQNYFATSHNSTGNYITQFTGQAPNKSMNDDCPYYSPFLETFPGQSSEVTSAGQFLGNGCILPTDVPNFPDQLDAAGLTWKGYFQDMGNDPALDGTTPTPQGPACGHPKVGAENPEFYRTFPPSDKYALHRNPFIFMDSVIKNQRYCDAHVLSLQPLAHDLKAVATTPNFSFIEPNFCNQFLNSVALGVQIAPGCTTATIDAFYRSLISEIEASPAYQQDGLIEVVTDESGNLQPNIVPQETLALEFASCCGEPAAQLPISPTNSTVPFNPAIPNYPWPGGLGAGGGPVGAVFISPFIEPGTVTTIAYNHFSLLRTNEQIFGFGFLGDAAIAGVASVGNDVFNQLPNGPTAAVLDRQRRTAASNAALQAGLSKASRPPGPQFQPHGGW
ncbi:MAG: phosphoesterase [Actinobacteria bacterium]|nr:phosphoesterase [Actinomycetota bacterium]